MSDQGGGSTETSSPALERFRSLMRSGRYQDAASLSREQHEAGAGTSGFWLTLEASALTRGGHPEHALESARRALELEPTNPFGLLAVGNALLALEKVAEALDLFKEAANDDRTARRARRAVVECLEKLRRWEEVLERIDQWGLEDRRGSRIRALCELGRHEEALAVCELWLQEDPEAKSAVWAQAELEEKMDGLAGALERAERRARIPSLPAVYREVHASLLRRAGKEEEAARVYQQLQATGASPGIQNRQAFALAKSGHEEEAVAMFEQLLLSDPRDKYLHSAYQAACGRLGDLERVINFYNRLLHEHPEEKGLYGRIKKIKSKLEEGGPS